MSVTIFVARDEISRVQKVLKRYVIITPIGSVSSVVKIVGTFLIKGSRIVVLTENEVYVNALRFYFAAPVVQKTKRTLRSSLNPDYIVRSGPNLDREIRNAMKDIDS